VREAARQLVALLDGQARMLMVRGWAPSTRGAYNRGLEKWRRFRRATGGTGADVEDDWTAGEREQWAVRFFVWMLMEGYSPATSSQQVYSVSGALRGLGRGALLAVNSTRKGRLAVMVKGATEWRRDQLGLNDGAAGAWLPELGINLAAPKRVAPWRPLTLWELDRIIQWWLKDSGDPADVAARWCAVLLMAYFACWRPSNFVKQGVAGRPWQRWLVRQSDIRQQKGLTTWRVRDQKTGFPFTQGWGPEGAPGRALEAMEQFLRVEAKPGKRTWMCWLWEPTQPITAQELEDRWARGVVGARLAPGVSTPYALRRGGATFWVKEGGLSWQQVAAAHGWRGATVKRYIMVEDWVKEPAVEQ